MYYIRVTRALASLVILSVVVLWPAASFAQVDAWRKELDRIDNQLREKSYEAAKESAERLADRMVRDLGAGPGAAYTLAVTCAFRAIAEVGLGNEDVGLWYWRTAHNVFNDVTKADLSSYGSPAEFLKSSSFRARPGKVELEVLVPGGEIEPPKVRKKPKPKYPKMMQSMGVEAVYAVQVVVETDGSISEPLILRPVQEPTMAYVILESIRQWEFKPARREGKAVPVLYNLHVNFKLRK